MVRIENLKIGGMRLLQEDAHLKLCVDSILLAAFARPKRGERVLELGCGNGVVEVLMAARDPLLTMDGVEIDEAAAKLAKQNIELNGLGERIAIYNRDLRALEGLGEYGLVVSNPPYRKAGSGGVPESLPMRRALFEIDCTVSDVCRAASKMLKNGGTFACVYRPERLADLFCAMRDASLEPKRLCYARHTAGHKPSLVLVEGRKGGASGLVMLETLSLKKRNNEETLRYKQIYEGGRL